MRERDDDFPGAAFDRETWNRGSDGRRRARVERREREDEPATQSPAEPGRTIEGPAGDVRLVNANSPF